MTRARPAAPDELSSLDAQYVRQAAWFYGVRSSLLRRVGLRDMRLVLDLGCGTGVVTEELVRRCAGCVMAADVEPAAFGLRPERFAGAHRVAAAAERLPFADGAFDMVFTQMLFLWLSDAAAVAREARRVLKPCGVLMLAAEPDYGGRIEHPDSGLGARMQEALRAIGADPLVARRLPAVLRNAGFRVEAGVHPSLFQPDELEAATREEARFLASLEGRPLEAAQPAAFLSMPYFWFLARKS
jgi:SAM-dependent methyltransferase